jgi:hypothetical protein
LLILKNGLPNLKNVEEASNEKKTIIYEYINLMVIKDVQKMAVEYLKKNKGSKVQYVLNPTEISLRNSDPLTANNVAAASNLAIQFTNELYLNTDDNKPQNAFLHSVWNAIAVRYVCQQTYNKWKGLQRTKKFTCAHEYDQFTLNVKAYTSLTAMDLHNNLVGRTYMYERVGQTLIGTANNIPDVFKIKADFYSMVKKYINTAPAGILVLSNNYNWESLEDYSNGMDYNTTYNSPFLKENLVYITEPE